eukprot:6195986-Pleurochrysis_carterae.AAC.3
MQENGQSTLVQAPTRCVVSSGGLTHIVAGKEFKFEVRVSLPCAVLMRSATASPMRVSSMVGASFSLRQMPPAVVIACV